jgi:FkbM family methyltransferase
MSFSSPPTYFSQMGEDKYIDMEIFHGKRNGVFVDIGAHDGKTFSNTYFLEKYKGWTGICVEPLPNIFKKLKENRNSINVNACVGLKEGKQKFLEVSGTGNAEMFSGLISSIDERQINNIKKEVKLRNGSLKEIMVKTIPLKKILKKNKIKHIDYCSIDTEGNELDVLRSIDFNNCSITCFTVEDLFGNSDLRSFMKEKGYKLIKKLDKDLVFVHKSYIDQKKLIDSIKDFSKEKQTLSVVIHTKNEENTIVDCIKSVKKIADEIIVADMKSTDKTVSIAKKMGAQIINVPDYGFADPARNLALSKVSKKWVLVLDADERITKKLEILILKIIQNNTYDVVSFPRKNFMLGKWIKHGLRWPDYQIRLFRKDFANWSDVIHDPAHYTGNFYELPAQEKNALVHYHSDTVKYLLDKTYLQASLERFYESQDKVSIEKVFNRMEREFPWRFYEHEGHKDKIHGLIANKFMEFYRFLEFALYWERNGKPNLASSKKLEELWNIDNKLNQAFEELNQIKDSKFYFFWRLYSFVKNGIKVILPMKR